jgi:hypothetical protein
VVPIPFDKHSESCDTVVSNPYYAESNRLTYSVNHTHKNPAKKVMGKIRSAFDADALKRVCELQDFSTYAPRVDLDPDPRTGRRRFYHYADNGSKILAVAHLDHVQADGTCNVIDTAAGLMAVSGALDDRLGAYVILELLPKLGITCDWLLTTDEEIGQSTAEEFVSDKDYNWIIEFDRGGTDVVMYDYETPDLVDLVKDTGARVGMGSFSDICLLEHLGVAAFNWGVGYQDYHGPRSHAWLEDTFRMVAYFLRFHKDNAAVVLEHDPSSWFDDFNPTNSIIGGWNTGGMTNDSDIERLNEWLKTHDMLNDLSEGGNH